MVSQMEACFTEDDKYVGCTATLNINNTNLDIGPGEGQVRIVSESALGYELEAISKAKTGGVNHRYRLVHTLGTADVKECDVDGRGGCPPSGLW
jgi:hypothetical protein